MQMSAFHRSDVLFLCISPFRSHWVSVFPAAVPGIPSNWSPVRPLWQTTFASSYHCEWKYHLRLPNMYWLSYCFIGAMFVSSHLILFLIIQVGLMLSYAVWAVSQSFSMFLLFRVIGGVCKGNVSLCTAIMADLPCPKARNRGMVSWEKGSFHSV